MNLSSEFLDIYTQIGSFRQKYHDKISLPDINIGSLKGLISFPRGRTQAYLTTYALISLIGRDMGKAIIKRDKRKINTLLKIRNIISYFLLLETSSKPCILCKEKKCECFFVFNMDIPEWGGKNKFMSRQPKGINLYQKWVTIRNTLEMTKMKKRQ